MTAMGMTFKREGSYYHGKFYPGDDTDADGAVFHETIHAHFRASGFDSSHENIVKKLGINLIDLDTIKNKKVRDALTNDKDARASKSISEWINKGCKN